MMESPANPAPRASEPALDATTPIVCRVTRWYYRRIGMLAGLFLVFGLLFIYDGVWGYPKSIALAKRKEWFVSEFLPSFDKAKQEGRLEGWMEQAKAQGLPTGMDGEPPRWVSYAAQNGWEEEPKLYSEREVAEQFWSAFVCLLGVLIAGVVVLLNRSKVLRGEADHWITPEGERIAFADVTRIDKRKWEHKGLAYAWHRTAAGVTKRAVLDDLKFAGTDKVLARLLSRFNGELIEKINEPSPAAESSAESVE